uniref:Uncharacterized protein n=1 Tax=Chromera velia CCMP2878 TaxID=1169474 RepID=A0A0G4IDC3_9ALVE|eukprot:Cvel_2337.t1-p1 / transcript=Cvel_2337.t1 / gene=Cvel_2337 / organism=Chromera_velia_CCMP2878 / gene_product=hypothetical protein / transcript_product=hypothetical protein / location=Cvel_scaffold90:99075-103811(+) / protein_length=900 / sequence_SO=supercontig / SO=protein_coding / is_pseudo=false
MPHHARTIAIVSGYTDDPLDLGDGSQLPFVGEPDRKGPKAAPITWPYSLWSAAVQCQAHITSAAVSVQLWDATSFRLGTQSELVHLADFCRQESKSLCWHKPLAIEASKDFGEVIFWIDLDIVPVRMGNLWLQATTQQQFPLSPHPDWKAPFRDRWTGTSDVHIAVLKNDNYYASMDTQLGLTYARSPQESRWSRLHLKLWKSCECDSRLIYENAFPEQHCFQAVALSLIVSFVIEHTYPEIPPPFLKYTEFVHLCEDVWRNETLFREAMEEGGCEGWEAEGERGKRVWVKTPPASLLLHSVEYETPCDDFPCYMRYENLTKKVKVDKRCVDEDGVTPGEGICLYGDVFVGMKRDKGTDYTSMAEFVSVWLYTHGYGEAGIAGPIHYGVPHSGVAGYMRFRRGEGGQTVVLEQNEVPSAWGALYPVRSVDGAVGPTLLELEDLGKYTSGIILFEHIAREDNVERVIKTHAPLQENDAQWFAERVEAYRGCHLSADVSRSREVTVHFLACLGDAPSEFRRWLHWKQRNMQQGREKKPQWERRKMKETFEEEEEGEKKDPKKRGGEGGSRVGEEEGSGDGKDSAESVDRWWKRIDEILPRVSAWIHPSVFCSETFQPDLLWAELLAVFPDTAGAVGSSENFSRAVGLLSEVLWPPPLVSAEEVEAALVWILFLSDAGRTEPWDFPGPENVTLSRPLQQLAFCRFEALQRTSGVDLEKERGKEGGSDSGGLKGSGGRGGEMKGGRSSLCSHLSQTTRPDDSPIPNRNDEVPPVSLPVLEPAHSVLWCSNDYAGGFSNKANARWPKTWDHAAPELSYFCFERNNPFEHIKFEHSLVQHVTAVGMQTVRRKCSPEWLLTREFGHECSGVMNLYRGNLSSFQSWRDPFGQECQHALLHALLCAIDR